MFISGALRAFAGATVACRHAATTSSKPLAGSIGSGQGSYVELFLSGVLPSTSVQSGLNMGRPAVRFMLSRSFSIAAADGTLAPVLRKSDDDALLAHPPTTGTSPLTVRYPFTIDYYKNREAVVFNLDEQPTGIVRLPGAAFNVPVRLDILHRVVRYWRAKWQQGTHKAKNRAEARGGGRKPWPQKKTSRARQGSIRSPLWKGGGTTHGPRPRSHAHSLPRSLLLLGMRCALSAKINEGRFFVVDDFLTIRNADTTYSLKDYRELKERLTRLTAGSYGAKWLLLDNGGVGAEALRLRKMLKQSVLMEVVAPEQLTVYHLLKYDRMVVTRAALEEMADTLTQPHRIKKPVVHAWWAKRREAVEAAERELLEAMRQD